MRGLYDEFEIAARLSLIEAPDTIRREQMTNVIDKLFPQIKADLKEKMLADINTWPPKLDPLAAPGSTTGAQSIQKSGSRALAGKLVAGTSKTASV